MATAGTGRGGDVGLPWWEPSLEERSDVRLLRLPPRARDRGALARARGGARTVVPAPLAGPRGGRGRRTTDPRRAPTSCSGTSRRAGRAGSGRRSGRRRRSRRASWPRRPISSPTRCTSCPPTRGRSSRSSSSRASPPRPRRPTRASAGQLADRRDLRGTSEPRYGGIERRPRLVVTQHDDGRVGSRRPVRPTHVRLIAGPQAAHDEVHAGHDVTREPLHDRAGRPSRRARAGGHAPSPRRQLLGEVEAGDAVRVLDDGPRGVRRGRVPSGTSCRTVWWHRRSFRGSPTEPQDHAGT